jgi:hypothetical protein
MIMGRTIPSFRIALGMEKAVWKPFRNALSKSEKKQFDEMFDIPKLYISACSNSVQLVPLHPIIISILFHHYKEMKECMSEVEMLIEKKRIGEKDITVKLGESELGRGAAGRATTGTARRDFRLVISSCCNQGTAAD